jgi:hypothetical protein
MRIAVHRQTDAATPRQRLRRFGMYSRIRQIRDKRMPEHMRISNPAGFIAVVGHPH